MKLNAPTQLAWIIALVLGVLAFIGMLVKCLLGTFCRLAAARAGNTPEGSIDPKTEKGCRFRQPFLCLNDTHVEFEDNVSDGGELFIYSNWDHIIYKSLVSNVNHNRMVEIFDIYTIIIVYQRKD